MEEIVTILSTREWAITIWGTGFFIWMLTQSEIRKSLWNVIKILLGKNLRRFFLIIALYVAGITMIFYQLPFWNNIYLKDIILWLIFSGISYCVNSIIKGDTEHLKSTVKDNFRVIVIFEYFIGTFTFKFWIEMLIIPVITILTLMNVVAESEEKYRGVHKLIDIVLACIGCESVCKYDAISVKDDGTGKIIYSIDNRKCKRCTECVGHFNGGCYMRKVLGIKRT